MPVKIVKINSETLPAIADAIRAKTGSTGSILPSQMAGKIANIHTGGELPVLSSPAGVGHVVSGKEYIDAAGNKQTGTMVVCDTIQEVETSGLPGLGVQVDLESTADGSAKTITLPEPNLKSENIVAGSSIFGVPGTAKKLRVETGTITPAEDMIDITIPEPFDGYCAFLLCAVDRSALEEKGADSIHSVRALKALDDGIGAIGVLNRYNGSTYSAATKTPIASDDGNIYIGGTTGRYFRAGIVYNYYVYYWEDNV